MILEILDRIFKDASGRVLLERVVACVLIITIFLGYSKMDLILTYMKESRYEEYKKIMTEKSDSDFAIIATEQAQIIHVQSKADFSAIYAFRPKDLNYFSDIIASQGEAPSFIDKRLINGEGRPIDKSSDQYVRHLTGNNFISGEEFIFTTSERDHNDEVNYMYSCPYFNMGNVYSGSIELYYKSKPPEYDEKRLFSICNHVGRVLGRAR